MITKPAHTRRPSAMRGTARHGARDALAAGTRTRATRQLAPVQRARGTRPYTSQSARVGGPESAARATRGRAASRPS
eukprot:3700-Pleurochrysis_carterae.AAC.1